MFRKAKKRYIALLALIGIALLLLYPVSMSLLSSSYISAYQGAKGSYRGVYYDNKHYTNAKGDGASLHRFNSIMKFDSDEAKKGQCNIVGELTAVQIPLGTKNPWIPPAWVPSEWWRGLVNQKNPTNVYEWEIKEGDTTTVYRMEEWTTSWYISVSAEWDSGPDPWEGTDETQSKRYHNLDVWFEIDISPTWYFENQTTAYFAVAKIELSHVKTYGERSDGEVVDATKEMRFAPMSPGSVLTIFTTLFGAKQSEDPGDFYAFQGKKLNPLYFRDKVYTYISLLDFGTHEWGVWPAQTRYGKGDVLTLGFTVTQFVVGEWVVKDVGDIPEEYGRTAKFVKTGGLLTALEDWFSNPLNAFLFWAVLIGLAVVAIVAFSGALPAVIYAIKSRRGKG